MSAPTTAPRISESNWWQHAACTGHDPDWWSDNRAARSDAVRVCVSCPVRELCLDDALRRQDVGVIRGGWWLNVSSRGHSATSLICANCGYRPVRDVEHGFARFCGRSCQAAGAWRTTHVVTPRTGGRRIITG